MHLLDRPIIILSAPRAGSTLLFEVLSKSQSLWTIGGESHALIETIPKLNIAYRQFNSNALSQQDIDDDLRQILLQRFSDELRDANGNKPNINIHKPIRFLEKTPKNSLRVDFFNALFPNAFFIYLVREPKENISSIIEAWRSNKFITYPNLPGWDKRHWSLLLPEQWQTMNQQTLQSIASFQWQAANEAIMTSLQKLPTSRWCMLSYDELISDPSQTIQQLCQFSQVEFDASLENCCRIPLPHSRYTLSTPEPNKWLKHYSEIKQIWPNLEPTLSKINHHLKMRGRVEFDSKWHEHNVEHAAEIAPNQQVNSTLTQYHNVSRNSPCPCGSGKRFKQCHGQLN